MKEAGRYYILEATHYNLSKAKGAVYGECGVPIKSEARAAAARV